MPSNITLSALETFNSRLKTLEHLLRKASAHFKDNEHFLQHRITEDMLPLGTQIAFTCNQPRNFSLWLQGKASDNLDAEVASLTLALDHIHNTQALLADITTGNFDTPDTMHLDLGPGVSLDLSGSQYINDFLIPNFYFHLVTAYDILRMSGVDIGKKDYMLHLLPYLNQ